MPTLPSGADEPESAAHRARAIAEGFGADAERYDRARTGYPAALIDQLVRSLRAAAPVVPDARVVQDSAAAPAVLDAPVDQDSAAAPTVPDALVVLGSGAAPAVLNHRVVQGSGAAPVVLDVGIGTGLAAQQLRDAGCHLLGVEADPRMAAVARRRGFEVDLGRFEDWDPAGRSFDAVVSAQSWHWIEPVAGARAAGRALRAGGRIALIWNALQPPPEIARGFAGVYDRVLPALPFSLWATDPLTTYTAGLGTAADGLRQAGVFTEPETWRHDWQREYTREQWLDQVPTQGGHAQLPPSTLAAILDGVGDVIDHAGGTFTMGYATLTLTAQRH